MFRRVAIIGVGLIGGSLGEALRARKLAAEVVGFARTPATRERAVALGALDSAEPSASACAAGADVVVLATPVDAVLPTLTDLAPHLAPGCLVTDVASTKGQIVAAAERLDLHGAHFVGGHPMAGTENAGVDHADPELFVDHAWAITPTENTDAGALAGLQALAQGVGARLWTLSPAEHDATVAFVSHLPHLVAYSLMLSGERQSNLGRPVWELAAGSFASATRVAASSPELWRQILVSNRDAALAAAHAFQAEFGALVDLLATSRDEELLQELRRAQAKKTEQRAESS